MSDIREAASISMGACDFCPSVHVNLLDSAGQVFASASVLTGDGEAFIAMFRAAMAQVATRCAAPAMRQ
jgi:hypothetical protein